MIRSTIFLSAGWALAASLFFSFNDGLIKFLSDDYALHQIVFIRSVAGVVFISIFGLLFFKDWGQIKTRRPGMHILRALCVVFANLFFYMALAELKLAEVVGIFFVAPFLVSVFSVLFLGEYVGPQRWGAIFLGFCGVLLIVKPGTDAFKIVAILPMMAATCYSAFHIMTRKLAPTETLASMTFYPPVIFVFISGAIGLALGNGAFEMEDHGSLAFVTRAWVWPATWDFAIMVIIGLGVTCGGYAISRAYRGAEAALVAPFEYSALIYAAFFGYVFFAEWPDNIAWAGIVIVLSSGLFMIWREYVNMQKHD